jgi:hypothetical protein
MFIGTDVREETAHWWKLYAVGYAFRRVGWRGTVLVIDGGGHGTIVAQANPALADRRRTMPGSNW